MKAIKNINKLNKLSAAFVATKEVLEYSVSKSQQTRRNYRLIVVCAFAERKFRM
jgi:hypothetical protein